MREYDDPGLTGIIVRRHVNGLCRFPMRLLRSLRSAGLKYVRIGLGSVSDFPGYEDLAGEQVPGYGREITWRDISGGYDKKEQTVLLGTVGNPGPLAAPHEMGHALGDILGYYDDFRLYQTYKQMFGRLTGFYKDSGRPSRRGVEEFFADSVACVIMGNVRMICFFDPDYVGFIREVVLRGRAPRAR